jgi:dipeptidyl aminopeptidase/acylaminoacyl peptidase
LQTVAERSAFQSTSRQADVDRFVEALVERSPQARRVPMGTSVEGRPITCVAVAEPAVATAAEAARADRLVVLIVGNIHAGECDGKEAILALIRDLCTGERRTLLESLVVLAVPNFNVDGNERVARNHRPGQVGPESGAGRRENAQGLDLNRDFTKLECPETQALVRLMRDWNPHVVIDAHTTNGSQHRYGLTYATTHNPAAAESIRGFVRDTMLPELTRRLEPAGLSTYFYGNFDRGHTRWTSYGHEPRYSIEYAGLRGRVAILAESYSYSPYRTRVEDSYKFLDACLRYAAEHRAKIRELVTAADRAVIEAGLHPAAGPPVPVRAKLAPRPAPVTVKGFEPAGAGPNQPRVHKDYMVTLVDDVETVQAVPRPFAYVIPPDQSRLADKLQQHGIAIERLREPATVAAELYRLDRFESASEPFQGHRLRSAAATRRREPRRIEAGSFVVRTAQPLGDLVVYLLEPESDDGLLTWNFLDHLVRSGSDYPVLRIPAAAPLATAVPQTIEPTQRLDLSQIYGPDGQVPFAGVARPTLRWLAGGAEYLLRAESGWQRVRAETSEIVAAHSFAAIERALRGLPDVPAEAARDAARVTDLPMSADGSTAVLALDNDLFRYSFGDRQAARLTRSPEPEQHAAFSPDGKYLAFVRRHNLHVLDVASGQERPLTTEGTPDLLHGELDWVYQEEVYGRGNFRAFWWSPDSKRLALLRLDESPVHRFTVVDHLPYRQDLELTPYPKAGDPLPRVALGVVDAAGGPIRWFDLADYAKDEPLIVRVGWTPNSRHVVWQVQNREQTWLDLRVTDPDSGMSTRLLRETSPAWVEILGEPRWLPDGSFLWLSERSGYRHIYHISAGGGAVHPVTAGSWEVRELGPCDPAGQWVYFTGAKDSPTAVAPYRVRLDGTRLERLAAGAGSHTVEFNDAASFLVDTSSDWATPPQTRLCGADGRFVRAIEPNLVDHLRHYRLGRPESLQVPTRDGFAMEAMLIKPPDFDPTRRYPVLCYVYGGPQTPVVRQAWLGPTYLWHQMLAQRGYVIWMCDNRSASSKGIAATWPIHRRMGELELQDIEDGLTWLRKQPWVDRSRIGIWGWSYGGYMAAYALTHSSSFKVGIAGAPVTDWRNYDAIYTERYMGLPQANPEGYRRSSVVHQASALHGRLLLLHGTTDDNVHLTNTLQLADALQRARKQFDLMLYPRSRHGVTDPVQLRHLRELMTRFIEEQL